MGFYIRKSIKAGPFRFNLSKSGVGVSAGITGLRVGTGPKGHYIHMGRGGLYYRKTLGDADALPPQTPVPTKAACESPNVQEIKSGDIAHMTDSSSAELLAEFESKIKTWRLWPWVALWAMFISFSSFHSLPPSGVWLTLGLELFASYMAYLYDQMNKSVVLLYDMEPGFQAAYECFYTAFGKLRGSCKVWRVVSQSRIMDQKRHAGAGHAIDRQSIFLGTSVPPYVKTNIPVASISIGTQTLFFFPDRLLVFEGSKVGAVSYDALNIKITTSRFIEEGSVPRDAHIVDHTWQYVNKSGSPDKRFKNNRQIPICLYEDMHLTSATGLNERITFSKSGNATEFKASIQSLNRIAREKS